jgi:hypothetical protein
MLTRSSAITAGSLVYDKGGALAISRCGRPKLSGDLRDNFVLFSSCLVLEASGKLTVGRWIGEGEKG